MQHTFCQRLFQKANVTQRVVSFKGRLNSLSSLDLSSYEGCSKHLSIFVVFYMTLLYVQVSLVVRSPELQVWMSRGEGSLSLICLQYFV